MTLRTATTALLGLSLTSLALVPSGRATDLDGLCGDYSFLGSARSYTGRFEKNERPAGLVLYEARGDSGRVLALYAYGPKPGGNRQGCIPRFGKLTGDKLVVWLSRSTKTTYTFAESGEVSLEWSQKKRNGKTEKLRAKLSESR